ncbi:MAG: DUF2059 domain-containing protein [Xanthomonadaceae bacterium]|nr:DUF2059 domain-containing protein [Xanthomonadaceae bacterium]
MTRVKRHTLRILLCALALTGMGNLQAQSTAVPADSPAMRRVLALGEDRPDRHIEIMRRAVAPYLADAQCPEAHRPVDAFMNETRASMALYLDQNRYVDSVARIYESAFTAQELDELAAFFESDIGRRLLEKRVDLFEKNHPLSQVFVVGCEPEFNMRLERLRSEINRLPPVCGL